MADTKVTVNIKNVNAWLLVILLIIMAFSLYSLFGVKSEFKAPVPAAPVHLAALTVTVLTPPDCKDCFASKALVSAISQLPNVNVTEKDVAYNSDEGKALIEEYKLTRAPAMVITGEIENITVPSLNKTGDGLVFSATPPPYYDVAQKRIVGRVEITFIADATCKQCFNISEFGDQLKQVGVSISTQTMMDVSDNQAKLLLQKYGITKVPAMLLSSDALLYDAVKQAWPQVGSQAIDGTLVLRTVSPPYKDLATKQVRGLITITYLTDSSCPDCYNVTLHKLVLQQSFGANVGDEKYVDVTTSAGKALAQKYNISLVPTVLLDKEAEAYAPLVQAWPQIGTRHADGVFTFDKVNLLGGVRYKNLATGEVLNSTEAEQ
jgi:glutaredoxin